jgi:hypothetical protein
MSSAMRPAVAEMQPNIEDTERTPRLAVAIAAGAAAFMAPGFLLKGLLLTGATAVLATVATGYCPVKAALGERDLEEAHWRTLKTHRVTP